MKAKKVLSVLLSLVMATATMVVFTVSAGAANVKELTSGEAYSAALEKYGAEQSYKFTANKAGTFKLQLTSQIKELRVIVSDASNNTLEPTKYSDTLGTSEWQKKLDYFTYAFVKIKWNSVEKKYTGTLTFSVEKGTYYLKFLTYDKGEQTLKFIPTFPSKDSGSSEVKISYIVIPMKVGDTLSLGTALSAASEEKVTWKSSKTSVAKVTSTGKVTAKAAGTAVITATLGSSTQKIMIQVAK